jgi:hypothetical protein
MDRRYTSEEELCAGGIGARNVRVVQSAGLGRVRRRQRGIRGDRGVRVVAEPLYPPIPHIWANIGLRSVRY